MTPRPELTIIVPFYNAERYIGRCIEGLLSQRFDLDRVEILMVDNNSTDRSAAIVSRCPRVRLLTEARRGAYAARNRALGEARGDLIAFTDPDCVPDADWLTELTAPLADPLVQVVNGRADPAARSGLLTQLAAYEHHRDQYVVASHDPTLYSGHTNNLGTRRSALEEVGRFVERDRGSDVIFVRRVIERHGCPSVRYAPSARVLHLEIDSVGAYFRKAAIYRRSRESYGVIVRKRPPTLGEKLQIFGRALRAGDITPLGAIPTLLLLTMAKGFSVIAPASGHPRRPEDDDGPTTSIARWSK